MNPVTTNPIHDSSRQPELPSPKHTPNPTQVRTRKLIPHRNPTQLQNQPNSMKSKIPARHLATFIALSFGAVQAAPQNGQFSWANLGTGNSDALVGLSAGKTYLENVNLFGGALTINDVPFTASTVNNPTGTGLGGTTWG